MRVCVCVSVLPRVRQGGARALLHFLRPSLLLRFQSFLFMTEEAQNPNLPNEKETVTKREIELVDAGLEFNSPYPPLLRPQRGVDLFISFEFSARDKDEDLPFNVRSIIIQSVFHRPYPFKVFN